METYLLVYQSRSPSFVAMNSQLAAIEALAFVPQDDLPWFQNPRVAIGARSLADDLFSFRDDFAIRPIPSSDGLSHYSHSDEL